MVRAPGRVPGPALGRYGVADAVALGWAPVVAVLDPCGVGVALPDAEALGEGVVPGVVDLGDGASDAPGKPVSSGRPETWCIALSWNCCSQRSEEDSVRAFSVHSW